MRTALFLGSFNPVHVGHLMLAQYVLNFGGVDDLWLVVSPQNPFKSQSGLAPADVRLRMAELATGADDRIRVSDVELRLPQPSYTINTIDALEAENPGRDFIIVMGGDNLAGLPRWREADRLIRGRRFIVYPRLGEAIDSSPVEALGGSVSILNAPMVELSSTQIRRWIADGVSVRHFVPDQALPLALETYARR
ncbi:MAG: nicotinate (nicotinamide) nucleotide adenylyltransferase [Marinilabiliaceae bacterium]